ncbi:MAG TPA: hypothetical protein DDY13_00480 [Cytophagales bacterium]|jgi:cation:H+ antiporter|nr:hypothetical protein [Cytophagales bacterium]
MVSTYILLVVGLIVLLAGGDFLVKGSSNIALRLHMSPLVIGLTIVAFGTSAPELFISVNAALNGSPDITMGNVIGSNICNLALVLGVTAVINPVQIHSDSLKIDWPVTMAASLFLYYIISEGFLSFWEGIALLILLIIYIGFLIFKASKDSVKIKEQKLKEDIPESHNQHLGKNIVYILIGIAGLYFGSEWFVGSARDLAITIGIDERIVGLTVVALGTSLPEMVTSGLAAFKGETNMAMGNLLGSNIFNILSILGFTSIIHGITVSEHILNVDILWMLLITVLVLPLMISDKLVNRTEGIILLLIYGVYIYSVFMI